LAAYAFDLGFPSGAPQLGGDGLGFIGRRLTKNLLADKVVCKIFEKILFHWNSRYPSAPEESLEGFNRAKSPQNRFDCGGQDGRIIPAPISKYRYLKTSGYLYKIYSIQSL